MKMYQLFSVRKEDYVKYLYILGFKFKLQKKRGVQLSELEIVSNSWKFSGASDSLISYLQLLASAPISWVKLDKSVWLIYISCLLEKNMQCEALQVLKQYVNRFGLLSIHNYLPVAFLANKNGFSNDLINKAAIMFDTLNYGRSNNLFEKLCYGKSIAIVGNGPQQIGEKTGQEIDSHDLVIRFNDFGNNSEDYGSKKSVCCKNFAVLEGEDNHIGDCDFDLLKIDIWHRTLSTSAVMSKFDKFIKGRCDYIPFSVNQILEKYSDCDMTNPTLGYIVLLWVNSFGSDIKKLDPYGFGFLDKDNYRGLQHYYGNRSTDPTLYGVIEHKHEKECKILKNLFFNK